MPLRSPSEELPSWWEAARSGDFTGLDAWLAERGSLPQDALGLHLCLSLVWFGRRWPLAVLPVASGWSSPPFGATAAGDLVETLQALNFQSAWQELLRAWPERQFVTADRRPRFEPEGLP